MVAVVIARPAQSNLQIVERRKELSMAVKPIPEGYHSVTPYLVMKGAARALDFYKSAFGAQELFRMDGPNGTIGHAEMKIGDSIIMLADESPETGHLGPDMERGTPVGMMVYVEDCDAVFHRAVGAGAKEMRPLEDQFYGDRSGTVKDPFGHVWMISTHKEDLSPEEISRRAQAMKSKS
jgi:PhnB protein